MPRRAVSSLDRASLVPTADSWAVRPGFAVSAVLAGSAGFQISAPDPASARRYVAVCDLVDLTLSSPWMVFGCWMFDMDLGRSDRVVHCVNGDLGRVSLSVAIPNSSRANESITSPRHRAKTTPQEQSTRFPYVVPHF